MSDREVYQVSCPVCGHSMALARWQFPTTNEHFIEVIWACNYCEKSYYQRFVGGSLMENGDLGY